MLSTRQKTKIAVYVAVAVFIAQAAFAERVLYAGFLICNNDTVTLNHLTLENGYPTKYISPGDHKLELLNTQGEIVYNVSVDVKFLLYSDPPVLVNCSPASIRVPYDGQMRRIDIYRKEKLIYSQEIKICNNNSVCDIGYETYLNCPKDCAAPTSTTLPTGDEKPFNILSYLPYAIVLTVLVIAAYFIHKKTADAKIKKEREEFMKWKETEGQRGTK
jgi:hypothetical protein